MNIIEIKKILSTLIEYKDSTITYTIPGLIELVYSKAFETFQITTVVDGKTFSYYDVDTASDALYMTLNPEKKEVL
ncbi:hypothetical protein [Priestia endophytica]|uniref:Uncharacterized protein n=1 Tax=Priestia endophytica TaxID=135735 RepID=A0AAX1Q7K8_9BACI|nr:hypothetical protein [Priestia endophytica]RAS75486.1 hypothetical protein A3864_15945 [Priestia endophytica]